MAFDFRGISWLRGKKSGMAPETAHLSGHHLIWVPPPTSAQCFRPASPCGFLHAPHTGRPPRGLGLGLDSLPEEQTEADILHSRCQVAPSDQSPLPALCCNQRADMSPG
ncbi:unnamed protein product [Pipistrellus nathusii]|uniref:Uncharacterized protein n=1 Tax=Pipistrellus nathusii TaxID=59473 RepID=A0ABP0AAD2_PIPNA